MKTLFRYRPLSDFLFKELYYQEIYLASYKELNDPMDMSARIEFSAREEVQVDFLLWMLFKVTLALGENLSEKSRENNSRLLRFNENESARKAFQSEVFLCLTKESQENAFIDINLLTQIVRRAVIKCEIDCEFDLAKLKSEIARLSKKFLANSFAACFSEKNDNLLLWAHYASGFTGVCLEFNLANESMFPYLLKRERTPDENLYRQRMSKWTSDSTIFWEGLRKVAYQDAQSHINFFEFAPVFDNEDDADLLGLSKSWTHGFALELLHAFSCKTKPWSYEEEWRAVQINFGSKQEPEDRIRHYPIEVLSSIYFGLKTPDWAKNRIWNILKRQGKQINFFECTGTDGQRLNFEPWECFED